MIAVADHPQALSPLEQALVQALTRAVLSEIRAQGAAGDKGVVVSPAQDRRAS